MFWHTEKALQRSLARVKRLLRAAEKAKPIMMTDVQLMLIEKWEGENLSPLAGSIWCDGDDIGDDLRVYFRQLIEEIHRLRKLAPTK